MKTSVVIIFNVFTCLFAFGQQLSTPENYIVIDSISGDLDKDGIKEIAIAYNIRAENESDESIPRELIIYKLQDGEWIEWKKSNQVLYGSRDGGMMGDPYGSIEIEKGILIVSQSGGSSWKWTNTDKYRFQSGEFYLIGYSSYFGKPCEYWTEVDFNLSTGKLLIKKEVEDCEISEQKTTKKENETIIEKGLKITLQNRHEKDIKIVTPKFKHEIFIATKND